MKKQQGFADVLLILMLIAFVGSVSFFAGRDAMRLEILNNCIAENSELPHNRVRTFCTEKTGIDKIDKQK